MNQEFAEPVGINYVIVEYNNLQDLTTYVNYLINQGWKCAGGVAVKPETADKPASYLQALTRGFQ